MNSLPRSPILPPHSGHTQFRMPEITSAIDFTVVYLTNCIRTSQVKITLSVRDPRAMFTETKSQTPECIYSSKAPAAESDSNVLQKRIPTSQMKAHRSREVCKPYRGTTLSTS